MALRLRKDIKKSSYYVWFLGAKESQGLRGEEYVLPVIQHLIQRERDIEPFKVTLQVSHKGLKIVQNIVTTNVKNSKPKNETIKHFIPHNTITCVLQSEDIVACILLLFNPVTKCPLHVHAYRCDSLETANLLKMQLQTLIERPENQKKFAELEQRLKIKNVNHPKEIKLPKKKFDSSLGSDAGTSTRESESSEERFSNETRVATLYDSLAAELRHKLGKNDPILLPPRDYDTVHRQKGNLTGIELRRCLNTSIVGANIKNGGSNNGRRGLESSGGSSGIGSDHAPSPDNQETSPLQDNRYHNPIDNQSSSDEDWNNEPVESTLYLMHGTNEPLPRIRGPSEGNRSNERVNSTSIERDPHRKITEMKNQSKYTPGDKYDDNDSKYHEKLKYSSSKDSYENKKYFANQKYYDKTEEYPKNGTKYSNNSKYPSDGLSKYREIAKIEDVNRYKNNEKNAKMSDQHVSKLKYENGSQYAPEKSQKYIENTKAKTEDYDDCPRYFEGESPMAIRRRAENRQRSISPNRKHSNELKKSNNNNNNNKNEQTSPVSPRDRFKDAKEKFLSLEKQRLEEQEKLAALRREKPISPVNSRNFNRNWGEELREIEAPKREMNHLRRHESVAYNQNPKYEKDFSRYSEKDARFYKEDRYNDDNRRYEERNHEEKIHRRDIEVPKRYDNLPNQKYIKDVPRYDPEFEDRYPEENLRYVKGDKLRHDDKQRYIDENRRYQEERARYPEEKAKYPEDRRYPDERYPDEKPRFVKSSDENLRYSDEDRYDERHRGSERYYPKPAPRMLTPSEPFRDDFDVPLERYRSPERYQGVADPKRRSMYNLIEDEHKRSSNEIAKELKRRTYVENSDRYYDEERYYRNDKPSYIELNEHERYPGLDREDYRLSKSSVELDKSGRKISPREITKSTLDLDQNYENKFIKNQPKLLKNSAGYRHSYAEPKIRMERLGAKKLYPEMLHRTNSSVSNSGRVGIASIHPY